MKTTAQEKTIHELADAILPILRKNGVLSAFVFGSFARAEASGDSDLDLLIELEEDKTFLDFVALKLDLEKKLRRKVDLVTRNSLHPLLKDFVCREQIKIL